MKLIAKIFFLFLIPIIFIYGCSNNTVRDYTTLKQKALEIPPEFDLTPPVEGKENIDEEDAVSSTSEDLEDILKNKNFILLNCFDVFFNLFKKLE